MFKTQINYLHRRPEIRRGFRSGVSLHGHTLHSRESITLLARAIEAVPGLRAWLRFQHHRFGGTDFEQDVSKFWWTSPLSAAQALNLERAQIEDGLGLKAVVSLSDHDNIEAPMQLQFLERNEIAPVSVEWTMPFEHSYFHIGVHNLCPQSAKSTMDALAYATETQDPSASSALLHKLAATPGVLIVFNHPIWDLPRIGFAEHRRLLAEFISRYKACIHALEINGLRHWRENRAVIQFAKETGFPVISGGDRHGREPNAVVNLTNAGTFAEFVEEIRSGYSQVLVMPQYREPLELRIIQTIWDILRDDDEHSLGWTRWPDRVFKDCEDGQSRSLARLLRGRETPLLLRQFVRTVGLLANPKLRPAWQLATAEGPELTL